MKLLYFYIPEIEAFFAEYIKTWIRSSFIYRKSEFFSCGVYKNMNSKFFYIPSFSCKVYKTWIWISFIYLLFHAKYINTWICSSFIYQTLVPCLFEVYRIWNWSFIYIPFISKIRIKQLTITNSGQKSYIKSIFFTISIYPM